jgi:hypothetical protein
MLFCSYNSSKIEKILFFQKSISFLNPDCVFPGGRATKFHFPTEWHVHLFRICHIPQFIKHNTCLYNYELLCRNDAICRVGAHLFFSKFLKIFFCFLRLFHSTPFIGPHVNRVLGERNTWIWYYMDDAILYYDTAVYWACYGCLWWSETKGMLRQFKV